MPTIFTVRNEERPPALARTDGVDLEARLVRAVLARESIIAITGSPGSGKTALLNRTIPVLSRSQVRVVQIGSPEKEPLDLRRMLDQLIDAAPDSGDDPAQRFVAALTRPRGNEHQVALFIDDAEALTDEVFDCLGLVAFAASTGPLPLQIVLAGHPDMWARLRAHPTLIANGIATQLVLGPEAEHVRPETESEPDQVRNRSERRSGPFDDLFEPGPWLPEPPAGPGRDRASPAVAGGITHFKPVPTRATSVRKRASDRREGPKGRVAWALAAVGLLAAVEGATFWDRFPIDEIRNLLGFDAALRTDMGSPAPTPLIAASKDRQSVAAATSLPSPHPEMPAIVTAAKMAPTIVPAMAAVPVAAPERPASSAALPEASAKPEAVPATPQDPSAAQPIAPPVTPTDGRPATSAASAAAPDAIPPLPASAATLAATDTSPPAAPAIPQEPSVAAAAAPPVTPAAEHATSVAAPANQPSPKADSAGSSPASEPTAVEKPAPAAASPGLVEALLTRGDTLLGTGDIAAARLLYERAAASRSGRGALAAGMTYDPRFLAQIGSQGITPDPRAAAAWYRRASSLGETQAAALLARLGVHGNE